MKSIWSGYILYFLLYTLFRKELPKSILQLKPHALFLLQKKGMGFMYPRYKYLNKGPESVLPKPFPHSLLVLSAFIYQKIKLLHHLFQRLSSSLSYAYA